jgi:hypothetical protein
MSNFVKKCLEVQNKIVIDIDESVMKLGDRGLAFLLASRCHPREADDQKLFISLQVQRKMLFQQYSRQR